MHITTRIATLFILSLMLGKVSMAQDKLTEGWKSFNDNNLNDARANFKAASVESQGKAESFLALSLLNTVDKEGEIAFNDFINFFNLSADPNPYLHAMWYDQNVMGPKSILSKTREKFLQSAIASGKLNSTMLAKAYFQLGKNLSTQGKFEDGNQYFSKIGAIMNWQLVGNFENISESGFDKKWEAIEHPEQDYTFYNRSESPVKWFEAKYYTTGQWIHPGYHSYTSNSIMFAQTFVKFETEKEVHFRIGVSGSLKVWVNDQLIFTESEERNNGIDAYIFTAKFNKGFNRILIQLGEGDDVKDMNFLVRLTDLDGKVIEGLEVRAEERPYTKETNYQSMVIPNFCEIFFEQKLKQDDKKILNYLMLAKAYTSFDHNYETRKVLLKAQEIAPNSSYISNLLMNVYIREDAETLLSLELEKVKKQDSKNPLSLDLLFEEAMDAKDYDEASKIVDQIEDIYGKNEKVYSNRISILSAKESEQEMLKLMQEAYSKFPSTWEFVRYKYLIAVKVNNDYQMGISILKSFTKNNYHKDALEVMCDHYSNIGAVEKAISIYQQMAENEPYLPGYLSTIASIYADKGEYQNAIKYYKKVLENAPYIGYYMSEMANSYKELDNPLTKETYEKALVYSPTDFDSRTVYREYIGKKNVFDYFEKPDLYSLFEKSASAKSYPEDNSLIIKYETQKVMYAAGGVEEKVYILVKMFNTTGIDSWKDYEIGYNSVEVEKAEVLKANGNKLKAEVNGSRVIFTNLEENDGILLIYTVKYSNGGKLLKHFWDDAYFNIFFPYNSRIYSILVENPATITYEVANSDLKPTIEQVDDEFTKYTWQKTDEPSVKEEKYMAELDDFSEVLHISTIPSWNWVNQWYYDISTAKAKNDFEVQDVTKKLLEGKENLSDREKIHLIYDYVVKNIRYSSIPFRQNGVVPQKASKVINTKIGDCKDVSTLFIAMCREAGFKAEIVLVNTRDNGEHEMTLPSINFNHAIAKVYVDNTFYIVELTSDLNAFSTIGRNLKKAFVLEINNTDSKPYLLDAPTRVPNAFSRTTDVKIIGDNLHIVRKSIRYGDYAAITREEHRDIGDKKREQNLQTAISDDFPHAKLISFNFDSTLYTTDDSVSFSYEFEVYEAFTSFNNTMLIEIPITVKQDPIDFLNTPERKYPVAFWKFNNDDFQEEVCKIHIPANMMVVEVPKNTVLTSPYADYKLSFRKVGNDLEIIRSLKLKTDIVPTKDFKTFAAFYAQVIKADKTQIGFKMK